MKYICMMGETEFEVNADWIYYYSALRYQQQMKLICWGNEDA